jgi:hypothetical protein
MPITLEITIQTDPTHLASAAIRALQQASEQLAWGANFPFRLIDSAGNTVGEVRARELPCAPCPTPERAV